MLAIAVLWAAAPSALGQGTISREPAIKAAYLYNFARYVTWPTGTFPNDKTPLVIGVFGPDPVTGYLEKIARQRTKAGGRRIEIRRCRTVQDCAACHMLFLGKAVSDRKRREIIQKLDKQALLLVGHAPGFVQHDGIINFYIAGNKVRFEINPDIAQRKRLKMSSKLLALAKIVRLPAEKR